MAFAEDEDIDAPWFRDPDGKNIVCVLATTFDIGTLFMAPSTTQPQSTSTHLHASTSSDANQESGLRTASASGNLSSDKERLIEYFGIPRHLIGTKNQESIGRSIQLVLLQSTKLSVFTQRANGHLTFHVTIKT
ncbi:hypothetical protein CPB84DRAFT_1858721 [Gymnopilus junonius]|uniref:Uncharacterized protein n=1 Tax=Gymnopilus junonius TaxID=109634 RepID=A0A9P5N8I1_GYMJU|nr:hypothetical protein CPB84DRAFT_1858721 [Gymnopilus junonius]